MPHTTPKRPTPVPKKTKTPTLPQHRILIVDDHPLIRESLTLLINSLPQFSVCAQAESYQDALRLMDEHQPDAAVMDLGLKDVSGVELIEETHRRHPSIRLLVLSMFDEQTYGPRCMSAGASGYVMKSEPPSRVVEGLQTILTGALFMSQPLTNRMVRQAIGEKGADQHSPANILSQRELEVFRMLGRGFSTIQIGEKLGISPKTVQTYREHIKEKLDIEHATDLIRRAAEWTIHEEHQPSS